MRLDPVFGPDAGHGPVREIAQFGGQLARGPVRRSVRRLVFGCPGQDSCLDPIGHFVARASGVASEQPRQPIRGKALVPTIDVTVAAVQLGANLDPREPLSQQQNQTGVPSGIGSTVSDSRLALKFHVFAFGQYHHALHRRHYTTFLNVTVH